MPRDFEAEYGIAVEPVPARDFDAEYGLKPAAQPPVTTRDFEAEYGIADPRPTRSGIAEAGVSAARGLAQAGPRMLEGAATISGALDRAQGAIASGATVGNILKTAAATAAGPSGFQALDALPGNPGSVLRSALEQTGREAAETWAKWLRADENRRGLSRFTTQTVPEAIGGMLPAMAMGPAAPVAMAVQGATSGAAQAQAEAQAKGADQETIDRAILANAAIGLSEAWGGTARTAARLGKVLRGVPAGKAIGNALAEAGQESLQSGGQQLAQNIAARATYDPTRQLSQGVGTAAAAGAVVGGIAGGAVSAASRPDPVSAADVAEQLGKSFGGAQVEVIDGRNVDVRMLDGRRLRVRMVQNVGDGIPAPQAADSWLESVRAVDAPAVDAALAASGGDRIKAMQALRTQGWDAEGLTLGGMELEGPGGVKVPVAKVIDLAEGRATKGTLKHEELHALLRMAGVSEERIKQTGASEEQLAAALETAANRPLWGKVLQLSGMIRKGFTGKPGRVAEAIKLRSEVLNAVRNREAPVKQRQTPPPLPVSEYAKQPLRPGQPAEQVEMRSTLQSELDQMAQAREAFAAQDEALAARKQQRAIQTPPIPGAVSSATGEQQSLPMDGNAQGGNVQGLESRPRFQLPQDMAKPQKLARNQRSWKLAFADGLDAAAFRLVQMEKMKADTSRLRALLKAEAGMDREAAMAHGLEVEARVKAAADAAAADPRAVDLSVPRVDLTAPKPAAAPAPIVEPLRARDLKLGDVVVVDGMPVIVTYQQGGGAGAMVKRGRSLADGADVALNERDMRRLTDAERAELALPDMEQVRTNPTTDVLLPPDEAAAVRQRMAEADAEAERLRASLKPVDAGPPQDPMELADVRRLERELNAAMIAGMKIASAEAQTAHEQNVVAPLEAQLAAAREKAGMADPANDAIEPELPATGSGQGQVPMSAPPEAPADLPFSVRKKDGARVRVVTPEEDREYLAAVKRGDMETARQMVDAAANAAGYNILAFHGRKSDFNTFKYMYDAVEEDYKPYGGFWFGTEEYVRNSRFGKMPIVGKFWLNLGRSISEQQFGESIEAAGRPKQAKRAIGMGADSVIDGRQYVVFDPQQIKSAAPVTFDDNSNPIPLSERFNPQSDDIRFSVRKRRSDLATNPTARRLMRLVDAERDAQGIPAPERQEDWIAAGEAQLAQEGEAGLERVLAGQVAHDDKIDVSLMISAFDVLGARALANPARMAALRRAQVLAREKGSEIGRAMKARQIMKAGDSIEGRRRLVTEAIITPSAAVETVLKDPTAKPEDVARAQEQADEQSRQAMQWLVDHGYADVAPAEDSATDLPGAEAGASATAPAAPGAAPAGAAAPGRVPTAPAPAKPAMGGVVLREAFLKDRDKVAAFMRSQSEAKSAWLSKAHEFWRNGLLGLSHPANILSTGYNIAQSYGPQKLLEASLNQLRVAFGAGRDMNAATFSELRDGWRAMAEAAPAAARNAIVSFATEMPATGSGTQFETAQTAIGGKFGRAVRAQGYRMLLAEDEFFKTFVYNARIAELARRAADKQGLTGAAADLFAAQQRMNPPLEMRMKALEHAKELAFQAEPGEFARKAFALWNQPGAGWALKFIVPFKQTPLNVLKQGLRQSPLGALRMAAKAATGKYKGPDSTLLKDAAEQIMGGLVLWAVYGMMQPDDKGMPRITGSATRRNADPGRAGFEQENLPPQSIRIGDRWYSFAKLEPMGTALTLAVDAWEAVREGKQGDNPFAKAGKSLMSLIRDKSMLQGLGDVLRAWEDPDRFLPSLAENFAASWMPNIVRGGLWAADPKVRGTFFDMGEEQGRKKDEIPFGERFVRGVASRMLPIDALAPPQRMDLWGNDLFKGEGFGPASDVLYRLTVPLKAQKETNLTNLDRMLFNYARANPDAKMPDLPPDTFTHRGVEFRMTPEEYRRYVKRAGQLTEYLAVQDGRWNFENPSQWHIDNFRNVMEKARERAREELVAMRYRGPDSRAFQQKIVDEQRKRFVPIQPGTPLTSSP